MSKKKWILLFSIVTILFAQTCLAETLLELNFEISNQGKLLSHNINVKEGVPEIGHNSGDYGVYIYDKSNNVLWKDTYEANFLVYTNPPSFSESATINGWASYSDNMVLLQFKYKDLLLYEEKLQFCNNNLICEPGEKVEWCGSDCIIEGINITETNCTETGENKCLPKCIYDENKNCINTTIPEVNPSITDKLIPGVVPGKTEPKKEEVPGKIPQTPKAPEQKSGNGKLIMVAVCLIIILGLLIFLWFYKKSKNKPPEKENLNTKNNLRESLKKSGWSDQAIDESLNKSGLK